MDVPAQAPLKEALIGLGMQAAFDENGETADFSGMTPGRAPAHLRRPAQVFIAVDEAGTEAAAATAVVVGLDMRWPEDLVALVVDRPFLFVIHDVEHGTPLFLGKVVDPR